MYLMLDCNKCNKPKHACKCSTAHKGWFWDHVNKTFYRWHDLQLLMREREIKLERKGLHQQNPQETS